MKLAVLDEKLEPLYLKIAKQDFCDYYFYIYDWLLQKERTQVFMALEGEEVWGLLLIYAGKIVQLRGTPEAAEFLLDKVQLEQVELQAPLCCEPQVLQRFPQFTQKMTVDLMCIQIGEENLHAGETPQRLNAGDARDIAALMRDSYPQMWSEITAEYVGQLFGSDMALWLGIRQAGKLASFGYAMLTPKVSHVMWIATDKNQRQRGYATAIVSALVQFCLKKAPKAMIYVDQTNVAAKAVYLKIGFRPYKRYLIVKT
jgi:predicted GNAT family acetyltransferase